MKKIYLLIVITIFFGCTPQGNNVAEVDNGEAVKISLNFDDIEHHELRITYLITGVSSDTLYLRMPQSSPGRYALHQFAKNVYSEKATDTNGNNLPWVKTDVSEWAISGHSGNIQFEYTLYANRGGGTYTGVDNKKVHMNMPATFMYPVGYDYRSVELFLPIDDFDGWSVATQLKMIDESNFSAPDFYYFFDSPTIAGKIDWRKWNVNSGGKEQTIRIAMMHEGTDDELDNYTEWVKKVVAESINVYGELPDFDFGEYTFLTMYNPWVFGDGMEHRNSTICSSRGSLAENASGLIGTISHEFFHAWNVERIRPRTLEPFDFDKPNMSGELWFAEGFTSYYDDLILERAGIRDSSQLIRGITGTLNYVLNSPGREYKNVIEMSRHAPFVDAATAIDETNFGNIFISYYSYGAVLGLALDLTIRNEYEDKSLDDVMKFMWENYGKTSTPYTVDDIENAVASITGDVEFASQFFDNYIYQSNYPDLNEIFAPLGLKAVKRNEGKAGFQGLRLRSGEEGVTVQSLIRKNNPLYEAGVTRGDLILEVDGMPINSEDDFFRDYEIGNSYSIKYIQRGETKERSFTAKEDLAFDIEFIELSGETPTPGQIQKRKSWLNSISTTQSQ